MEVCGYDLDDAKILSWYAAQVYIFYTGMDLSKQNKHQVTLV